MQELTTVAARPEDAVVRVDELTALYRLTDKLYRAQSRDEIYDATLDAIIGALGCDRASILLFNSDGVMEFVAWRGLSEEYRTRLRGHSPWKPGAREAEPIFVSDIDDTDEADWVKAMIRKEGIRALGFIPLVAEGEVIGKFMTYYPTPRRFLESEIDLAVTIARQLGFSLERERADAARLVAEQELRESEERFRLMSESAPVMIWMSDAQGRCLHLNKMLRDFWGVGDKDLQNFDWQTTMHPEDAPDIGRLMMGAIQSRSAVRIVGRYKGHDGAYRVLETDARPRFSASGDFLGMIGVNTDISERKRAEAQRELLLAELNHRVKNTLAVVQSIAHQTFRGDDAATKAFEGRLLALAAAHNLLTRSNWESTPITDIAADTLHIDSAEKERIRMSGPPVLLAPRAAVAIAMALHELCTNAMKYGALSNETGWIELTWESVGRDDRRLHMLWREHEGPQVSPPQRRGFGSLLLERSLAHDLNGTVAIDFRPDGLVCEIDAPLSGDALPQAVEPLDESSLAAVMKDCPL